MSRPSRAQKIRKPYYLEVLDVIPTRYVDLVIAMEMRRRGFTFLEIGQHFRVSQQAAQQLVRKYERSLAALGVPVLKDRKHKKRASAAQTAAP